MANIADLGRYETLAHLADDVLKQLDKKHLVAILNADGVTGWTGQELRANSRLIAYRLHVAGVRHGEPVLVLGSNSLELGAFWIGIWRLGAIPVPVDSRMTADTIDRIGRHSGAKRLVLGDVPSSDRDSLVDGSFERMLLSELASASTEDLPDDWHRRLDELPWPSRSDLIAIMYTSGTTAEPRGVMLSHATLIDPYVALLGKRSARVAFRLVYGADRRLLALQPMSHVSGLNQFTASFMFGNRLMWLSGRTPKRVLEAFKLYRPTSFSAPPRFLELLWRQFVREIEAGESGESFDRRRRTWQSRPFALRRFAFRDAHALLGGALKRINTGSAYLPPETQGLWESIGMPVNQAYGATETGTVSLAPMFDHRTGSVGKPMAGVKVDFGSDGEILISGPSLALGYWRDSEATAASWDSQGRYHTGDIGKFDERGNLVLIGRKKNVIVLPNGLNVYPEDIEAALHACDLRDAVVVETAPGRIEAVILDTELSREEVASAIRAANARLNSHQRIDGWRIWPDSDFPRTHTEKVRRDPIREWASTAEVQLPVIEAAGSEA